MNAGETLVIGAIPDRSTPAGVRSVAKAARILRSFDRRPLTVRELAARTGLPRSTCHAICSTLVAEGLLELLGSGGYQLGPSLVGLGGQVIERVGLAKAAAPVMRSIGGSGTVHLAQLIGRHVVHLAYSGDDPARTNTVNQLGKPVPVHQSTCGRAALARMTPTQLHGLRGDSEASRDDLEHLVPDPGRTARSGFTASRRAHSFSVGSAIASFDGTVVGAITITVPAVALTNQRVADLEGLVCETAADVSSRLIHGQVSTRFLL